MPAIEVVNRITATTTDTGPGRQTLTANATCRYRSFHRLSITHPLAAIRSSRFTWFAHTRITFLPDGEIDDVNDLVKCHQKYGPQDGPNTQYTIGVVRVTGLDMFSLKALLVSMLDDVYHQNEAVWGVGNYALVTGAQVTQMVFENQLF